MSQTRNGKPLLIPDHVSSLLPFKDEKILYGDSNTKLSNKKSKLSIILLNNIQLQIF